MLEGEELKLVSFRVWVSVCFLFRTIYMKNRN